MSVKRWQPAREQFFDSNGAPLSGGKLFFYIAGSSAKQNTYSTSAGLVANSNPMILDSAGRPSTEIWLTVGQLYKVVLATSTDSDPPTSPIWTEDNIGGINDSTVTLDEWVSGPTPTYISSTSFSVAGDQTSIFTVGRRVKITDSGGTKYGTIKTSAFTTLTTITLDSQDSDALATPTSAVSYGLLNPANTSHPVYSDAIALVGDPSDRSKRVRIDVGLVTAGNTRVWNAPDADLNFFPRTGWVQIAEDAWLYNATLAASVAANALTIGLKTKAGADPSATDPVFVAFRNATLATGDYTVIKITAATSIVVSSGSTLGTVSGQASRIYVTAHNDAGTFRLGVYNPWNNTTKSLQGLDDGTLYSSTAEGGAGAADSAQVIYTGTAVASKAARILGYVESTQATAGTWATTPSKVQLMGPGVHKTGQLVQTKYSLTGAVATGTTVLPMDDTIPQNTEGDEYMTLAITPTSVLNLIMIESLWNGAHSTTATSIAAALFRDAVADALAAAFAGKDANADRHCQVALFFAELAPSAAAITYKLRAGNGTAGTTTFNGAAAGRLFGGVMASYMKAKEVFV